MTDIFSEQPEQILNVPLQNEEVPTTIDTKLMTIGLTSLDEDLQRLEQLSLHLLQDRWRVIYGQRAPRRLGAEFLRRALAYRLQEVELGGLSRPAQLRLKAWSRRSRGNEDSETGLTAANAIKIGTRFVREWQGETHEVTAVEDEAFVYRGKTYRSLTVVAREITGTHQSGPRFFGLRMQNTKLQSPEQNHGG